MTDTNVQARLVNRPQDQSIFVHLDRVRQCKPQQGDQVWTGPRVKRYRRKKVKDSTLEENPVPPTVAQPLVHVHKRRVNMMPDMNSVSLNYILYLFESRTTSMLRGGNCRTHCFSSLFIHYYKSLFIINHYHVIDLMLNCVCVLLLILVSNSDLLREP